SDPVAQGGGREKHPLADREVRNDVVHQMRCRIRHPSPSARRAYASGLAGERHDAVQPAGVASDPEEARASTAYQPGVIVSTITELSLDRSCPGITKNIVIGAAFYGD